MSLLLAGAKAVALMDDWAQEKDSRATRCRKCGPAAESEIAPRPGGAEHDEAERPRQRNAAE